MERGVRLGLGLIMESGVGIIGDFVRNIDVNDFVMVYFCLSAVLIFIGQK